MLRVESREVERPNWPRVERMVDVEPPPLRSAALRVGVDFRKTAGRFGGYRGRPLFFDFSREPEGGGVRPTWQIFQSGYRENG